jgi:hypothetical protein
LVVGGDLIRSTVQEEAVMAIVDLVLHPDSRDIGGFSVRRALPAQARRMIGPFVFFDHLGPAEFAPGRGIDVRPHPHINLATVTYLFAGEILHRDSLGYVQLIQPGEVNWMTAGSGIVHSERSSPESRARSELMHGIQTWIALPADEEERDPCFVHHARESLPAIEETGRSLRIIAGRAFGVESPVEVFSAMFYVDAQLAKGSDLALSDEHAERGIYVTDGRIAIAGDSHAAGTMLALRPGGTATITAETEARLVLFGGEPLGERFLWWNFVSSRRERIEQAKADWRGGRFSPVPGESEFIPLPPD